MSRFDLIKYDKKIFLKFVLYLSKSTALFWALFLADGLKRYFELHEKVYNNVK